MIRPAQGSVTQGFSTAHQAIDIANGKGTAIVAPEGGRITAVGQMGTGTNNAGLVVQIGDPAGNAHRLCHLNKATVSVGQTVVQGQKVGEMGNSGYVLPAPTPKNPDAGTHLHWVMWRAGKRVDGLNYVTNTPQGGNNVVPNQDNYYWRYGQKLAKQVRGRQLSREEFVKHLVGKTDLRVVEILSDDPEADQNTRDADLGRLARKDDWQGQINRLQAQVKDLNTRPTKQELDAIKAQFDTLAKSAAEAHKRADEISEKQKSDIEAGETFIRRLGQFIKKYL